MNIYVGNLAWETKRKELKELFENFGEVTNAFIVRDKKTRRSRGFGFVEMAVDEEAKEAIEKLNNTVFLERTIIVNEARPKNGDVDSGEQQSDSDSSNAGDDDEHQSPGESSNTEEGQQPQSGSSAADKFERHTVTDSSDTGDDDDDNRSE